MFWVNSIIFLSIAFAVYLIMANVTKMLCERMALKKYVFYDRVKRFINPEKLLHIQIVSGGLSVGVIIFILTGLGVFQWYILFPAGLFFCFIGGFAPYLHFLLKAKKRKQEVESSILDFVLALTNSMKAGLGLPQSLEAVTKRSSGAIQEEFQQLLREYRLGLELTEAFERLAERNPCEDLRLLVTSIKLTTKTGGSLVDVLQEMTDMIRQRTEFQEKLKTMTAQGRFEAIAISLSPLLAFGILFVIDRELMMPLLTTITGWISLSIIAALIAIGFYIINKIVTIEV